MTSYYDKTIQDAAESRRTEQLAEHDGYIVNALLKCSVFKNFPKAFAVPDWPIIFSLVWGGNMASHPGFPTSLQLIVGDILAEERKRSESYDLLEKQVHSIAIDLLQVMYEGEVNDVIKHMKEKAGME